jgi:hypothetical protein
MKKSYALTLVAASITSLVLQGFATAGPIKSTATLTQAGLYEPTSIYNGLQATTDNNIGWTHSPVASGGGADDLTGLGFWNGASIYMTWSGIQTITGVDLTSYGPLKPGVGSTPYVDPDRIAILGLKDGGTVGNNDDYTKVLYAPGSFSWTGPSSNYSGGQVFSVSGLNVSTTSLRIAFASSVPAWNQLGEVDVYGSAAAPAPTYASWAAENAGNQTAELDWDNDGVPNGVEFFMGSASGFTANPGLDGSNKVTWTNGGNIPSSAYGTQFVVQTSTDLTTWEDVLVQDLESNDGSLSYILNGSEKQFVRLKVTP